MTTYLTFLNWWDLTFVEAQTLRNRNSVMAILGVHTFGVCVQDLWLLINSILQRWWAVTPVIMLHYKRLSCWQIHSRDSLCWLDDMAMLRRPIWQGTVSLLQVTSLLQVSLLHWKMREASSQEPARSQGPQPYSHKEMNSANKLNETGSGFFPSQLTRWECNLVDTSVATS